MKHTVKKNIFIAIFFIIICTAHFSWFLFGKYFDQENYENRTVSSKPQLTLGKIDEFPKEYESYYDDNLPFRNKLIELNSSIQYYLFHSSANKNVVIGKDGWLFYNNQSGPNPVNCYMGRDLFTEKELAKIADNLTITNEYLADKGIEFILFIAPNKERIYSDKIPDYYGEPAKIYGTLQLINYLRENTSLRIVYPYEELMTQKNNNPELDLYYRLDTHWNNAGAYIGSRALLSELGIELPDIKELNISREGTPVCDLADMMNMHDQLNTDTDIILTGYDNENISAEKWDFFGEVIYHNPAADSRKIFIKRDSYATAMTQYIGPQFAESYMIHKNNYSQELIDKHNPDIFVYETVERSIHDLLDFCIE